MITVYLRGRFGNQLFQYAVGRHLAIRNGCDLRLDTTELLRSAERLGIEATRTLRAYDVKARLRHPWIDGLARKLRTGKHNEVVFREGARRGFIPEVLSLGSGSHLVGFFQSEEYFKPIESILRRDLQLREPMRLYDTTPIAQRIDDGESVSVHVRRGDYVGHWRFLECGERYYVRAMELIQDRVSSPRFFVFSDDLEWCRTNLPSDGVTFVDVPHRDRATIDFELMRRCRHAIISNSSYSWWGAWLIENEAKVVVSPERWFRDEALDREARDAMTPSSWLRID